MATHISSYQRAMDFLHGRIDYERAAAERLTSRHFKLDRMRELLSLVGNPHTRTKAVHIGGTKGKGSTSVMIAEMLSAAGLQTGLFTSPHVSAFEERMAVNGVSPTPQQVVDLVSQLVEPVEQLDREEDSLRPTYFEMATAMAWLFFNDQQTDIDVLEVGLGGRLDSTNLCEPELTIITNISRDHTHLLGSTPAKIAGEKAGILKPGIPVICGVKNPEARAVIESVARKNGCEILQLGDSIRFQYHRPPMGTPSRGAVDVETPFGRHEGIALPLAGKHQAANAALAIAAIDWLRHHGRNIPDSAIHDGMTAVRWPLRLEQLADSPRVIVDAAHNESSVAALCEAVDEEFSASRRILIFSASHDKDVEAMARVLFPQFDEVILTAFVGNPRAIPPDELIERTREHLTRPARMATNPEAAYKIAKEIAKNEDLVIATGSFYLAAEIRHLFFPGSRNETNQTDRLEPTARS
jgi:dihydrofolate synthase / folylpolyglutamate synthase